MKPIDSDKLDELDLKVLGDIKKHGWSDMSIFPVSGEGLHFNYTVGLAEMDHPDLLIVGFDNRQMHEVLYSAVSHIQKGNQFQADTYSNSVLVDHRVAFVEVDDPLARPFPMSMTSRLYGEVKALQLVWPDADDRFPWHDTFAPELRDNQPLAGTWKGEV